MSAHIEWVCTLCRVSGWEVDTMIPETLKVGVASILEDDEDEVVVQQIGGTDVDLHGNYRLLYQRDLLPNPLKASRSHRKVLSKYKIQLGGVCANVPWKNVAYYNTDEANDEVEAGKCDSDHSRFEGCVIAPENIKVIWMHRLSGSVEFRWFVAFKGDDMCLTPMPLDAVGRILREIDQKAGRCRYGECSHALLRMEPKAQLSALERSFDARAVRLFSKYRQLISTEEARSSGAKLQPKPEQPTEAGTCAVCLEDGQVRVSSCVHQRCGLKVCNDCFSRTRGMCALCDRIKLSDAVVFHCSACRESSPLSDFGYACHSCGKPDVCGDCHRAYGMCFNCELKESVGRKDRKRKCASSAFCSAGGSVAA